MKRNLGSPVKNCPKVSLIYLSESERRGLILSTVTFIGRLLRDLNPGPLAIKARILPLTKC